MEYCDGRKLDSIAYRPPLKNSRFSLSKLDPTLRSKRDEYQLVILSALVMAFCEGRQLDSGAYQPPLKNSGFSLSKLNPTLRSNRHMIFISSILCISHSISIGYGILWGSTAWLWSISTSPEELRVFTIQVEPNPEIE